MEYKPQGGNLRNKVQKSAGNTFFLARSLEAPTTVILTMDLSLLISKSATLLSSSGDVTDNNPFFNIFKGLSFSLGARVAKIAPIPNFPRQTQQIHIFFLKSK